MPVNLGERIRARRKSLGLTQIDLAGQTGIQQVSISEYELGKSRPSGDRLILLARALRVTAEWLALGGELPSETADDPPHWAEFLERYEHLPELSGEELGAIKRFAGRTHRINSWYDWVQLAEWLRNRQPSPTFQAIEEPEE